jgi:hypothetical protein
VKPAKPTTSVEEVHNPRLTSPDTEEIIIQNVPISTEIEIENKV